MFRRVQKNYLKVVSISYLCLMVSFNALFALNPEEQKEISLFWDCNPIKTWHQGHFVFNTQMISPGGHWLNIVGIASQKLQKSMMESLEAYTLVSIGLYDGFLSCWNEKYD